MTYMIHLIKSLVQLRTKQFLRLSLRKVNMVEDIHTNNISNQRNYYIYDIMNNRELLIKVMSFHPEPSK